MKLTDLYTSITSKEPYNDMDVFFANHESFEEFPLISRYSKANQLISSLGKDNTLDLLIGFSAFLLNSIIILARAKNINENSLFVAITFTDFNDRHEDEPLIPNIFIYPNQNNYNDFKNTLKSKHPSQKISAEMEIIQDHFSKCNLKNSFTFYESRFFDQACNEDIIRIYAIPNRPREI